MPSRWVLGILSTDYDLRDYRRAIIERLAETNVCVSAFEQPDFPVEPDQHSHENCVTALKRTNIAILIVDKRYGGIFYDSAKVSITMQEYLTAIERHIPCLVFVNKNTWDEAHAYKADLKASGQRQKSLMWTINVNMLALSIHYTLLTNWNMPIMSMAAVIGFPFLTGYQSCCRMLKVN